MKANWITMIIRTVSKCETIHMADNGNGDETLCQMLY